MTDGVTRESSWFPKVDGDGYAAAFILSLLATAGLFYVNIMSALVDGLHEGLGIGEAEAGSIGSSNVYGAAFGAFVIVFFVRRLSWRPIALMGLLLLIAIDLGSTLLRTSDILIPVRFLHGFIGGALVGTMYAVIARTKWPDRTFGVLLFVQFGLGGLGVMYLPGLVPEYGPRVLFVALAGFSGVALLLMPFLPSYPVQPRQNSVLGSAAPQSSVLPLTAVLLSLFFFQAGNMALGAYIFGVGKSAGIAPADVSETVGVATWVGMFGAVLVVVLATRFGRSVPLAIAMVLTVVGTWGFIYSNQPSVYFMANCLTAVTWSFVVPYLFGLSAGFDKSGQSAALGGFFSKMGLATGPLVGGWFIADGSYTTLIEVSVVLLIVSAVLMFEPALRLDSAVEPDPR